MEVSGTRRWLCPFCRLEITMAVARNLLDEEDESLSKEMTGRTTLALTLKTMRKPKTIAIAEAILQ
jgi:hypothetical protein